jgi:signal transduction histidine kinase/CheY-like chemotaxis protein
MRAQLVALVAAIVLPLAGISAWIAWQQYQLQREALGQTLLSLARALSAAADRELVTTQTLVETLALSPLIDEERLADHYALAAKAVGSRPGASIVLFTPAGDQAYNTARPFGAPLPNVFAAADALAAPAAEALPQGGARYVRTAFDTRRPVYSDLFLGQVRGQYLVAVSVPVLRGGRMIYCLTIALPVQSFQRLVADRPAFGRSGALLFDARGFIIARALRPETAVGRRVSARTLADMARMDSTFGPIVNAEGAHGFGALTRSPVSGWGAGVSIDEEVAFGAIWRSMRASAFAAALILLAGIAMALWMARTMARRESAEAQNRAKDEFIAALSHELRNPLAAISLGADLLRRMVRRDAQATDVVETVARQVTLLRRLLDDLLDNSRAMYGKLNLELRPVDLHARAAQIARDYVRRPAFETRIDVSGGPVWVRADPARVSQMIDNLLENAVKYGAKTVRIHVAAEGRQGVLTVDDDGQGISRELMGRLFQPFVQGAQSLERAQGGLGLGLALVRRIAQLHGGSVEARSEGEGTGSRFILRLPLAGGAAPETDPAAAPRPDRRRVLVVEDMEDARESLRALLEMEGHEVDLAADGPQALLKLKSFRPDVALIDIGLPGMNGYEVAREARAAGGDEVVLVALTGYGQEADRREALEAGFDLHLTKPITLADLNQALDH